MHLPIPSAPGSYLLHLRLNRAQTLTIGKLGRFYFPAGDYVYAGSAHGPGGVRARLGRHLRGTGSPRWHIDYLRRAAQVMGYGYTLRGKAETKTASALPYECLWSQSLAALPEAQIIVPGFGASDCCSGCRAHLVYLPRLEELPHLVNVATTGSWSEARRGEESPGRAGA
jgi:Uri superfamily endonuclease